MSLFPCIPYPEESREKEALAPITEQLQAVSTMIHGLRERVVSPGPSGERRERRRLERHFLTLEPGQKFWFFAGRGVCLGHCVEFGRYLSC
jgi:hypothetical protein